MLLLSSTIRQNVEKISIRGYKIHILYVAVWMYYKEGDLYITRQFQTG